MPAGREPSVAKRMDVEMLVMCSGRQRRESEYHELFGQAGFRLSRLGPTGPVYSVVEAVVATSRATGRRGRTPGVSPLPYSRRG